MTKPANEKSQPTIQADIEQAEELAQKARELRLQQCNAEIEESLKRYQCTFQPFFIIDGTQIRSYVNLVPLSANAARAQRVQGLNLDGKFG